MTINLAANQVVQRYLAYAQSQDGIDVEVHRDTAWYPWMVLYRVFEARAHAFNLLLAFPLGDWLHAITLGGVWQERALDALKTWSLFLFDPEIEPIAYFTFGAERPQWSMNGDLPRIFAESHASMWGLIVPRPNIANPTYIPDPEKTWSGSDYLANGSATMTADQVTSLLLLGRRLIKRDPIHDNVGKKLVSCLRPISPDHPLDQIAELMPWHDAKLAGYHKSIFGCSSKGQCNGFTYVQAAGQLLLSNMETVGRGYSHKGIEERVRQHALTYKLTYYDLVRANATGAPSLTDPIGAQQEILSREIGRLRAKPSDQATLARLHPPTFHELDLDIILFPQPDARPSPP